jgi:pimeloyl-ACP methyl ester carboxylesterase
VPRFASFDGAEIAFTVVGEGRPTLLLHGFMANADLNFIQPGIAERVALVGRQVILPDLRGHGASAAPEDAAAYPPDVLAMDQEALLRHLGLTSYDLVGYSLGARTAMRMLVRGARPKKAVLGGMGDSGIMNVAARRGYFADGILNGDKAKNPKAGAYIQAAIAERGLKAAAMLNVLGQQVDTTAAELAQIDVPMLIVSGEDDADNGSAEKLAELLPNAISKRVPGNHLTAVVAPELGRAIASFLG